MYDLMHDSMKRSLAVLGLVALAASTAGAQQMSAGPKWQGWIGCWAPTVAGESVFSAPSANGMFVCITPSSSGADAIDVTTVADGKVVSTQKIDASGVERPVEAKGCTGAQRATWSADERRVYLKSASICDGLRSATSAILSMTTSGEWLDIRGVSSYGSENVRVARYRDAGIPSTISAQLASALRGRSMSSENARIAAGAPIGTKAVVEASRSADSSVVSAWLLERDQRFALDAATLIQLADAGVPASVTDALVAVSNPRAFQFARSGGRADVIQTEEETGRRVSVYMEPYDPWGWGYSRSSRYGNGYGYNNGYGYGYGGYNGGYFGGYSPPIIIVNGSTAVEARGQAVKGRGYTQTQGTPSNTGARERSPSSSSGSPSSSGSSSGSSSNSPTPAPAPAETRTAKPRP